jgi:SAM-dependent methyltransferase
MRTETLDILLCPRCTGGNLQLRVENSSISNGRVETGVLYCDGCNSRYDIRKTVPDLLIGAHSRSVQKAFSQQWKLRNEGIIAEDKNVLYFFDLSARATQIWSDLFPKGKPAGLVLDAGCGNGDLIAELANRHSQVQFVGIDFSETIYQNASKHAKATNIDWIRGDVSNPPFKKLIFDGAYSSGVLHHTSNTRQAFGAVANLVKSEARFFVWLYPLAHETAHPRYWNFFYRVRYWLFLGIGHYLPSRFLVTLLRIFLLPTLLRGRAFYNSLTFVLFDDVAPKYQNKHSKSEVETWYREENFPEDFKALWDGAYVATKNVAEEVEKVDATSISKAVEVNTPL